jgi:hypothetical protein
MSCSSKLKETNRTESECKLFEQTTARVSFSDHSNDIRNEELELFYSENNVFDVIFYYRTDNGSGEYKLKRIYKNNDGTWFKTMLHNGKKSNSTPLALQDLEIVDFLNKVDEKSYFKHCDCFGCDYNTFLIKSKEKIFQLNANNDAFSGINIEEREKLQVYISIYNFFFDK